MLRLSGERKLLAANVSWQGLERGLRILAGVFTGILLAAYLGPGPLGIYSYGLSFVLLFTPVITLGYDSLLPRDIVYEKDKWHEILGTAAFLRLGGALLTITAIWIYTIYFEQASQETVTVTRILSLSLLFYPFDVFDIWFRARMNAKMASIAKIIALVVINGLKLVFIYLKYPLTSFAWLYTAEFFINGLLQAFFYWRTEPGTLKTWRATTGRIQFVLKETWPLFISAFSYVIYSRIDQVMIGNLLNKKMVGIFSAADKISDMPVALILVLNGSLYPLMAEWFKTDRLLFEKRYLMLTRLYTLMAYIMLLVVIPLAGFIISIYPQSFAEGADVLRINFIGVLFIFNSGLRNSYLSLAGKQRFILHTTLISALMNVLLNWYLIPNYGINGAAWASVSAEFLSLFLLNAFFPSLRDVFKIQAKGLLPVLNIKKNQL